MSAVTASQLKRQIDQSMENVMIERKRLISRDVSPLFKQQTADRKARERQGVLRRFLEANLACSGVRRETAKTM